MMLTILWNMLWFGVILVLVEYFVFGPEDTDDPGPK